ncbi:DUF1707 SHOCT-like domain-containing protein [Streptomyces otsuchiensis]|uniref:DUF1707 SHOCT-like domain-containing protein n=1 Tax=Streptomyces otsuchiensis TaxID=2681388 RepID=UPI00103264C5|nr:DUF1707 domain-containing protein [Streptomyces otsuchiensis]
MTNLPPPHERDPRADLRISDSDREAVAELLREAAGDGRLGLDELDERLERTFAAKTYAELEPVTADLPGGAAARAPEPAAPAQSSEPLVIKGGVGGENRTEPWVVPTHIFIKGGMGGVKIDFTQGEMSHRQVEVEAHGDVGGVTLIVPATWRVEVAAETKEGIGGVADKTAKQPQPEGDGPLLRVVGSGGVGGVTIRRLNRWEQRKRK